MIRHPGRRLGERCLASVTRAYAIPSVVGIVNTGTVVIHGKYRSSEVNKSIGISIIDRNVYRWVTAKRWFSQHDQKRRHGRTKCDTKTAQRKIAFTIKIEIDAEGLSRPKSMDILTALRCISGPNVVILAWTGDKLLYRQAQNRIHWDLQVKFDIEDQGQSTAKTIGFLTVLRCISGPDLVILT